VGLLCLNVAAIPTATAARGPQASPIPEAASRTPDRGAVAPTASPSPRELYQQLNALRVNPSEVYAVKNLLLRKEDVRLILEEGKLAFFAPAQSPRRTVSEAGPTSGGQITGAVFLGRGQALAFPRDSVEKQQLARFLGAPLLDQPISKAYLRFTDDTEEELKRELRAAASVPQQDAAFAQQWNNVIATLNRADSLRILEDWLAEAPEPYFCARLDGLVTGPFSVLLDGARRMEPFYIGQQRTLGQKVYDDAWASYAPAGWRPPLPAVAATEYDIETTVFPDHSLEGATTIHLRAQRGGDRVLEVELSPLLSVQSVDSPDAGKLDFFQNEDVKQQAGLARGNQVVLVVLPQTIRPGEVFALRLRYKGSVISDAGNGVLFVGDRGSWYPRIGGSGDFAPCDIKLRWPRQLKLVATGKKLEEHDDGEFRAAEWRSEQPIAVAGFNLGDYASQTVNEKRFSVKVYASREMEAELAAKLTRQRGAYYFPGLTNMPEHRELEMPEAPSPADALKGLGRELASAVRYYEQFSGPFPYAELNVSQIPGTFGQGWPGLLYISTLSFLPRTEQQRAGLSSASQEQFSELMPFHEVAHQWWGNVVGWSSYRDQWIDEALANYLALMFADTQRIPARSLRYWLEHYRAQLLERPLGAAETAHEAGPLVLGNRLISSKSPDGFEPIIYGKGTWVIHMLRMMLRQPGSPDPDARFRALLKTLVTKYRLRALSTQDLQREVEAAMTPAMDLEGFHSMEWFFAQWVRGTGIPRYHVDFSVRRTEKGSVVRGALRQTGVPQSFIARVPLYALAAGGKQVYLGTVIAGGEKTTFHFSTPEAPKKLLIDPQMTLLCATD
jgi:hypothetical protein